MQKPKQNAIPIFFDITDARDACHCISVHSTEKSAVSRPMFTEEDALMGCTRVFPGLSAGIVVARSSPSVLGSATLMAAVTAQSNMRRSPR
ncbi:MAG TPA: hypothetical protein VH744_10660 [Terriglobales bacterium]|jgi:hypothetical protein